MTAIRHACGLLALVCLLLPLPAWSVQDDASQPIHIEGDNAEIDQKNEILRYRGNVVANQGTMQVTADEMEVKVRDNKVVRITAVGKPARYQQEMENQAGDVHARATTIVYHTSDEMLDLTGDAKLEQQGNELSGESIRYDIVAGKVAANSGDSGRVGMTLQPESKSGT